MSEKPKQPEWFENWFDSKYYHILYKNRDEQEAKQFIDNLLKAINLPKDARVLDLACGAGRHAIYMNGQGYDVIGIDLSEESIKMARRSKNDTLDFFVHDMRDLYWDKHFDCVLNLFTSFGYFKDDADHQKTITSVAGSLKYGGKFVLDFLNAKREADNLVLEEKKVIDGVSFHISKRLEEGYLYKRIEIQDGEENQMFEEKVRAFTKDELVDMIMEADLRVEHIYGNYQLDKFDIEQSQRLIIVASK